MLVIVPITANKIEPAVSFVKIENALLVAEGQTLQLLLHGEIGLHVVKSTDRHSIGHGGSMLPIIIATLT